MCRLAAVLAALILLGACRSALPAPGPAIAPSVEPWELAPTDIPSQRLYRVQIRRAGDRASLRLVLRVWRPSRFEVSASDPLGRPLWAVVVRDAAGAWSEEGGRRRCRLDPLSPMRWPRLGLTLPAKNLALVLLGRLPEAPAAGTILPGYDGVAAFVDGAGQRWELELQGGEPVRWSLTGEGGDLAWQRVESGGQLDASAAELEVLWREVAREPLGGTTPALPPGLEGAPECRFDELP